MPKYYSLCLAILVVAFLVVTTAHGYYYDDYQNTNQTGTKRVKLGVFYESRCPDSKRFFLNQLVPTYKEISDIIELELVPFGHARVLSKDRMVCQHGQRECDGNKLMACIEDRSKSQMGNVVETIGCLFEGKLSAKECIKQHLPNVDFDDVEKCKNGEESYQMMVEFEKLTGRVDYIPDLRVDEQKSEEIQQECEQNLKNYICKQYNGTKPEGCKSNSK